MSAREIDDLAKEADAVLVRRIHELLALQLRILEVKRAVGDKSGWDRFGQYGTWFPQSQLQLTDLATWADGLLLELIDSQRALPGAR